MICVKVKMNYFTLLIIKDMICIYGFSVNGACSCYFYLVWHALVLYLVSVSLLSSDALNNVLYCRVSLVASPIS